ncbi:AMP-dependent synthetase/ligase [Demequina lutea]|uniref:Long-chain acyl-CoA synthetase n=1 Tax=Demequina lutea TaxID=431489 RepID=A0A7Y9ZBK7_9MICO|nr:long-chain fatty acid--CoA ligase [Demequina lutea]NYI41168.1 long-chain acyl-CoA synthetase [Demequina lutea]
MDKAAPTEFGLPALVTIADDYTVISLLRERASEHPDRTYCEHKNKSGGWVPVTLAEFRQQVEAVAKGIVASGVKQGDCVGLQASTRYEWALFDFAIMAAGAMTVPIYPSSSAKQLEWIVEDAALTMLIVETSKNRAVAQSVKNVPQILVIDGESGAVETLMAAGAAISDAELAVRTATQRLDDVASVVYTSGTTGNPKGVELTHRNLVEHALNAAAYPDLHEVTKPGNRLLLFLPLAHVLARHLEILSLASGMTIGFAPSPATLPSDLKTFKPHWMIAVPRVLEAFYNTAEARTGGGVKQKLFNWAARVSRGAAAARQEGRVGPILTLELAIADRLVLHKIRDAMGGQMRFIVCGGAKLAPKFGYFYTGLGVSVLEGYGLTESSAPTTCNPQFAARVGTVGMPLPGCTVRIADDGEVLLKGPNIFAGYRHAPELTAEVFNNGWFATGDLGSLDAGGYLTLTGRKKEIIVLDAGKNVQPAGLEDAIRTDATVQEVVVIGDGQAFVAALIALDEPMLRHWLTQRGLPAMTIAEAGAHPDVLAHLKELVAGANATVSKAESIRKFRVLPRPLTEAEGEFSASMKVRRKVVMEHFADVVEDIYPPRGE